MGGYRGMEPSKVHSWEILQNPWYVLDHCIECICASWTFFPKTNITSFQLIRVFFLQNHTVASCFLIDNSLLDKYSLCSISILSICIDRNDDNTKLYLDWRDGQILKGSDGNAFVWGPTAFGCVPLSSGSDNFLVLLNMVCDNHQACFLDQTTIGFNIFDDCPHLVKLRRDNLL